MSNYSFTTINDKEFEQLVRDLLNANLNLSLQNFKAGKDGGIDLRYSTVDNTNSIVVQTKHYAGSGYVKLKAELKSNEIDKVKKISPDRYIFATSVSLSPQNKDELKELFSPYILTSNDIFGNEDLNALLGEFKEIEKQHFKLWFSSINIFNSVINNAIEGRTKYMLQQIKLKIPYYVVTKKLDDAIKILQKEKLLLITGQPGIGKTTLAEIILFERAKNGHKIYKVEDLTEAETVISPNDDEKQLFYFDDFLGANYSEIVNVNKTENQITAFVDRIRNTPNKYLILTTRTVILNHATEKFEKISRSSLSTQQFELKLTDYTKYEKALILYNHLYFNGIQEKFYNVILNEKFYKTIIEHKNYTPRIIEFITDNTRIKDFNPEAFIQFIINNLNNPSEIWRYSFNNQIRYLDRCLLLTLFTFETSCNESDFIDCFENRLQFEKVEHNQIISSDQFDKSVKILLNGFIGSVLHVFSKSKVRQYSFINPSLADFLIAYVNESFVERKGIISSIKYIEQLNRFNPEKSLIPLETELQTIIRNKIEKSQLLILKASDRNSSNKELVVLMEVLCRYCNKVNIDNLIVERMKLLDFEDYWFSIRQNLIYVLLNIGDSPQTYTFIQDNFINIIQKLMMSIDDAHQAKSIPEIFLKFGFDYNEYTESEEGFKYVVEMIADVLSSNIEEIKDGNKDEVRNLDQVSDLYYEIKELESDLLHDLFPTTSIYHDFGTEIDEEYWNEYINNNIEKDERYSRDDSHDEDYYRESPENFMSEDELIDDLFLPQT